MQGISIPDLARVKNGDTALLSDIPYGKVKCVGTFASDMPVLVESMDGKKKMGPVTSSASNSPGNFIFYTDMYTDSKVQLQGVHLNFDELKIHMDAGKGIVFFFNLVYGSSFQVVVANTKMRIANNLNNMQSLDDMGSNAFKPSAIDVDGAGGFELRDMSNKVLATTPKSVTELVKAGTVTLVFIVGNPSKLSEYPYKIVATDLSCSLTTDSADYIKPGPPATASAGMRVHAFFHVIVIAALATTV